MFLLAGRVGIIWVVPCFWEIRVMLEELEGVVRHFSRSVIFHVMGDDPPVFPLESGGRIDVSKKAPFDIDVSEYRLMKIG